MVYVLSIQAACDTICGNRGVRNLDTINDDCILFLPRTVVYCEECRIRRTGYGDTLQVDVLNLGSPDVVFHQSVCKQCVFYFCIFDGVALSVKVCPESIGASLLRNQGLELAAFGVDVATKENGLIFEALARGSDQVPVLNAVDREGVNRIVILQVKCQTFLADLGNKTVCIGAY